MTIISSSTSAFYDRSQLGMQDLRLQAENLQSSIASGKRLSSSSDDPVAAARMRQLSRSDSMSNIDEANSKRASADLSLADGIMTSFSNYVIRVKELATQAANGTLSDAQRTGIGAEIAAIRENVIDLANSRDATGHALFGGQTAGDAYTVDASGNATYAGTGTANALPIGDGQTVSSSMTGPEFLSIKTGAGTTDLMAVLKTLADSLQTGSPNPQTTAHDSLDALNASVDSITTAQTVIGARMSWIDMSTQRRQDMSELRANEETDVGGTDMATAVAKLQETMTVLQASQASFAKLASLSLFDVMR